MKKLAFPRDYIIITYLLLNSFLAIAFIRGFSLTEVAQSLFPPVLGTLVVAAGIFIARSSDKKLIVAAAFIQTILLFLFLAEPYTYSPLVSSLGFIPLAVLIYSIIRHKINGLVTTAIFLLAFFVGMIHFLYLAMSGLGTATVLYALRSPDGKLKLVATESNQGALGGDVGVSVERTYFFGLMKTSRLVYLGPWGDRPRSKWLNSTNVEISNQRLDIYSGRILEPKRND